MLKNATIGEWYAESEMFRRLERQYFRDRLGTLGLQQLDGMILHLLGREGHMRQEDLAVQLAVDKGAVARSLARLEKRGLVERQVSARCRREKHVSLTSAGEGAYQGVQRILEEWGHVKYQGFTPEERALNEAFLTRIAENVIEFCRGEGSEHG